MAAVERIELDTVGRSYGRVWALSRVSTTFRSGRLIVLLGPNGAGKSTLLQIVATLQRPDRGTVRYDGVAQTALTPEARGRFGYVSHDALLYADLSGRENLAFFASLYGIARASERIDALLERVVLVEAADRPVRGYSRGMRQRLSIARALLQEPSVLILDEPFTGLDRWGMAALHELLGAERDAGRIVLLSTHQLEMPAGLCDEVRVLRRGRLVLDRVLEPGEELGELYARAFETAAPRDEVAP